MSARPVPTLDPLTFPAVPLVLDRPALVPPVLVGACCHCGTTGLDGDGRGCSYCDGTGLCHPGME